MCHTGRRHHGFRGRGRGERLGQGWYDRETVVERLESYQRDLEQELVDVSELLKRLRDGEPQAATV
jgi:hypothetical protein